MPDKIPFNAPDTIPFATKPAAVAPALIAPAPVPLSQRIWNTVAKSPAAITNALGLKGASDVIATNINNVVHPKLMQETGAPLTTLRQNIGAGAQLGAVVASGTAAPATITGNAALGGIIGAATTGGASLAADEDIDVAMKKAAIGGAGGAVVSGAISGIGKLITKLGGKISFSVIKPREADIADGFSIETVKQYDLGGPLHKTLEKTQTHLSALAADLRTHLQNAQTTVDLDSVLKQTVDELTDTSKLKGFGANTKILNTLNTLKEEVDIVGNRLDVPDAQVVKQAAGNFGAWQFDKPDPDSKATEIVYNTFYNKLKTAIEKASPEGVKQINQEIGKLIPVLNAVIRRLPVAQRNGVISLNEMIGLVGSTMHPAALGPTLLAIISRSGTAGAALSKAGSVVARFAPFGGLSGPQVQSKLAPTQEPSLLETQSYTDDTREYGHSNPDGSITLTGPFGSDVTVDPMMGLGTASRGAKIAAETLRDALMRELPKSSGKLNIAIEKEAAEFIKFLQETPAPTLAQMQKGLEILRLQGKNVKPLIDDVIETAQKDVEQLRDALGRFAE